MRKTLMFCALMGAFLVSFARPIDIETAKTITSKFMETNDIQLAATYQTDKNAAIFYIFNTTDGYVIVAADDCETPIIGYSHEGRFDPNNVPIQMEDYLQDFVERIQYGIENHIEADERTAEQWELLKATGRLNNHKDAQSIEPLLTEKWHQGCLYNSLCPEMSGPCDHAEVGCVAVAMGQIMHYWQYPATGWGSRSYSNAGIMLSADFGNTVYDWGHMPDSLSDDSSDAEIEAVATLLFHCGVSVGMKYANNGSGADSDDVPNALIRYFNYSRRLHFEKRSDFSDEEWMSMLRNCLDQQRPVYYAGKGNQGSHAFVCDGYDSNDLLHFNWGWGVADGYFALGSLNPLEYTFNEKNFAIFDIDPEYEPWSVNATTYPPTAGTIEGNGEYHIGEQCTLSATPVENSKFCYWKKGENVVSYETSYSFLINNDVDDIMAIFSYKPLMDITAHHAPDTNDVNSPHVCLSWDYDSIHALKILNQFEISEEIDGIATDGEYIYTNRNNFDNSYHVELRKYAMNGDLVDLFELDDAYVLNITSDGNYIYYGDNHIYSKYLYCTDFTHKTIVDSLYMNFRPDYCAYDAYYDSFWLFEVYPSRKTILVNRQGQTIYNGPSLSTSIDGFGSIVAEDGSPHLLLINDRTISNYDIADGSFYNQHLAHLEYYGWNKGACTGKYDGKNALFVIVSDSYYSNTYTLLIYEIDSHLAPIKHYRLYRADGEGHIVLLADEFTGTSFTDNTWAIATEGTYRFGISEVYHNGVESEIIWSNPIVKTDFGVNDNPDEPRVKPVMKVIENGHIVIIKDGKRYSLFGQILN